MAGSEPEMEKVTVPQDGIFVHSRGARKQYLAGGGGVPIRCQNCAQAPRDRDSTTVLIDQTADGPALPGLGRAAPVPHHSKATILRRNCLHGGVVF